MTGEQQREMAQARIYLLSLVLISAFCFWLKSVDIESSWQQAGLVNFSLGVLMLAAYVTGQIFKVVRLPLISAYIFAGILAGPYVIRFLTETMVHKMRLVDDLALSFIALTAGGTLNLQFLLRRKKPIILNITLQSLGVFGLVFFLLFFWGTHFSFVRNLSSAQIVVLALLLGVVAVARSPSSAIAIISECRARGTFTETAMGVTVVMDVIIIVLFTLALAVARILLTPVGTMEFKPFAALSLEIVAAIVLGVILGKGISFYIDRAGYDLSLFLLFFAFGVTKASLWLSHFMQGHFGISLYLEPLVICVSAGFTVQNFSKTGANFMESLDRISLPIYVLFFSLAGASLNLEALRLTWPLAVCLAGVRALGIFAATWLAGTLSRDPPGQNYIAWMAYLAQAGVAIGLAQLAERQFPEIGLYLSTVVLAVITINQVVGPIAFKMALNLVGETGRR